MDLIATRKYLVIIEQRERHARTIFYRVKKCAKKQVKTKQEGINARDMRKFFFTNTGTKGPIGKWLKALGRSHRKVAWVK